MKVPRARSGLHLVDHRPNLSERFSPFFAFLLVEGFDGALRNFDADHAATHVVSAGAFDLLTTFVVAVSPAVSLATVAFTLLRSGRWVGRLRRP